MRLIKGWVLPLVTSLLVACGGGGKSGGDTTTGTGGAGTGTGTGSGTIALSLSSTTVSGGAPVTVTAVVKDATGAKVAGQVVSFSTTGGLGQFSVSTALTDSTGTATVSLTPASASSSGADQVVAKTTLNGKDLSATAGFQLTASGVSITAFSSDLGASTLSAYGQTNLTVTVSGASPSAPVTVNLSSACVTAGKATLTPSSASTSTGTATFTFRDQGCGATAASDSLQATIVGSAAVSSLSIPLTSPTVQSITFVSASPSTIYLKGSGLTETSTVVFQVLDTAGNGLPNVSVVLSPSTLTGGLTLDGSSVDVTKLSDSQGKVTALINSGTVPTPVRVKATLSGTSISTVSSSLSIAVGLPSELNFSLSQGTANIEGLELDGTANTYNIIASDRLGNPVPDGTAINFVTEAGQIEPSKQTALSNGLARATANFVTASPKPIDGRVTILAYALGEESFLDQNGNNVFDNVEPFQDLGNVFLSRSFNVAGDYVSTDDQFISLSISSNQTCATVDALKDPSNLLARDNTIPTIPGTCDGVWGRAYVRRAIETVFSSSTARPVWASAPTKISATVTLQNAYAADGTMAKNAQAAIAARDPSALPGAMQGTYYVVDQSWLCSIGTQGVFSFIVADANGFRLNPMAAGTTITAAATDGLTVTVQGGSPVPNTMEASAATVSYKFTTATSGTATIKFTSPSGLVTPVAVGLAAGGCP